MNLSRIVIILCISAVNWTYAFGQIRPLEKFQFDSSYKIVGLPTPGREAYKRFSFLLDKVADMQALQKTIILEKKTHRVFEMNGFIIYIIKSNDIIDQFILSPANNNMPINGEFFHFDFSLIRGLAKKHTLNYTEKETSFLTKREYESYREVAKSNPKFLFNFPVIIRHEGTFEIVVPKSDSIQSFEQAHDSLYKEFYKQKLGPVRILYAMNDENKRHPERFVMHVETSKNVFDLYKPNFEFRKREWIPNKIYMRSIWKR